MRLPRLMLAACASASGKTTVACALLRALKKRGRRVAAFKCGPDFIDPMFHRESVGADYAANLDLFFSDGAALRRLLCEGAQGMELAVLEGVMGYYDGIAATETASSYAIAQETGTPVVLVTDCKGTSASIAAQIKGFCSYRPDANICAVILNRLPPALYPELRGLIQRECGIPAAGYFPKMEDCTLDSRHLGLVTAAEVRGLAQKLDKLAEQIERTVDLSLLEQIAHGAAELFYQPFSQPVLAGAPQIAVAMDRAFCFYYADTLRLLERLGARLLPFSPLSDAALPAGADGLLLGGGYPELYAGPLAQNASMRFAIKAAVQSGMPTVAECGGFLYLNRTVQDASGRRWPMAGVFAAEAYPAGRLVRFGYANLTAKRDNLLCAAGESLPAHEFHHWESADCGSDFCAQKPLRHAAWDCVHATDTLYAGFPHLYLAGRPETAVKFLRAAIAYRKGKQL